MSAAKFATSSLETFGRVARFLETCPGRDKVMRTVQYAARLIAHVYAAKSNHTVKTSQLLFKLESLAKVL